MQNYTYKFCSYDHLNRTCVYFCTKVVHVYFVIFYKNVKKSFHLSIDEIQVLLNAYTYLERA